MIFCSCMSILISARALLDDLGDGVGVLVQLELQQRVELQLVVHDEGLAADGMSCFQWRSRIASSRRSCTSGSEIAIAATRREPVCTSHLCAGAAAS